MRPAELTIKLKEGLEWHLGCVYMCLLDYPPAHASPHVFEPARRALSCSILLNDAFPKAHVGGTEHVGCNRNRLSVF